MSEPEPTTDLEALDYFTRKFIDASGPLEMTEPFGLGFRAGLKWRDRQRALDEYARAGQTMEGAPPRTPK